MPGRVSLIDDQKKRVRQQVGAAVDISACDRAAAIRPFLSLSRQLKGLPVVLHAYRYILQLLCGRLCLGTTQTAGSAFCCCSEATAAAKAGTLWAFNRPVLTF
jgi:hypothetical protein